MRFTHLSKQHSLALFLKENILGAVAAAFQSRNSVRPSVCRDSSIFLEEKCMIWKFVMINRIFSIIKIYTKVKNLTFRMWWHSSIHPSILSLNRVAFLHACWMCRRGCQRVGDSMGINRLLETWHVCSAQSWIQSSGDSSPSTGVKSNTGLELALTINTASRAILPTCLCFLEKEV